MQLKRSSTVFATLSAAVLFFAAAPAQAQGLVSMGSGSYKSPSNPEQTSHFSYYLAEGRNGTGHGYAVWFFPQTTIMIRVTSYGFFELPHGTGSTTALAFAGPIVAVLGNPSNPNAVVGRTGFSAFIDNGRCARDETVGFNIAPLPSQLPPPLRPLVGDLTTIQQIAKLLPFSPPPVWAPLLSGDVWVR
jgi:hypothetical protein